MRVVVTDWDMGSEEPVRRVLEPAGHKVSFKSCDSPAEVIRAADGAEALLVRHAPVSAEAFDALPDLRFVSRLGIGPWRVDLDAAIGHKVAVAHCPEYCTDEAIAHTLALVLNANRRLDDARRVAREGRWATYGDDRPVLPLTSLTLGLVGLGRMGQGLAAAARALGVDVIGTDPYVLSSPPGVEQVELDTLLTDSDIVCLLCPETPETRGMINAETLARMKPTAYLVNTARGGLVDEAALAAALDAGRLAGAALDVLAEEPPRADHPLLNRPDVVVTPHVAFYSEQSQHELKIYGSRNVVHYFTGEQVAGLLTPDFRRV